MTPVRTAWSSPNLQMAEPAQGCKGQGSPAGLG